MVYDEAAKAEFRTMTYEDALEELAAAVDRNFGDLRPGEIRLSTLLETIKRDRWRTSKRVREQLRWLASGADSVADRARITLLKRSRRA